MGKLKNVTDAEVVACHVGANDFLMEMHDLGDRLEKGYVDRIENPTMDAKAFMLIARAASNMAVHLLLVADMQKQKDEIAALKAGLNR